MTPEEKRALLKRQQLKEALAAEADEQITPAVPPADQPRQTTGVEDLTDTVLAVSQGLFPLSEETVAGVGALGDVAEAGLGMRGDIDLPTAYRTRKNVMDRQLEESRERSPGIMAAGELAAAVGTPLGAEGAIGKILSSAVQSALAGAGKTKASPVDDPGGFALDVGISGGLGGVGQAVGGKVAEKLSGKALRESAEERAVEAVARTQSKKIREAPAGMGRELLETGGPGGQKVVTFGAKADTMLERAKTESARVGQELGRFFGQVDEAVGEPFVDGKMIAERIRKEVEKFGGRGNLPTMQRMMAEADEYEAMGLIPFGKAQQEKVSWKFNRQAVGDPIRGDGGASNAMRRAISGEIEDALDRLPAAMTTKPYLAPRFASSKSLKGEYKDLNRRYAATESAEEAAEVLASRQGANLGIGLRELGIGAIVSGGADVALGSGGALSGATIAAMLASKLVKERGPAALSVATDKASRLVQAFPEFFNKVPIIREVGFQPSLGAAHLYMMETDPSYKVEVSNLETRRKAPRVKIAGLPLPMDTLGDDPFLKSTQLSQAIIAAPDGSGFIKNPEAVAQLAAAISESDDYDSVQKANLLSSIGKTGRVEITVDPEPPMMLERPMEQRAAELTPDRVFKAMKSVSGG